jgi:hypothetical protein
MKSGGSNLYGGPYNTQLMTASLTPSVYCYNFNGTGALFEGIDPVNSSFRINVKWLVEVFPNVQYDSSLVPLATPTPGYDPEVMAAYAKIVNGYPSGLPAGSSYLAKIPAIVNLRNAGG